MSIETSHGKARPTLPRAKDLPAEIPGPTDHEPRRTRGPGGRFAEGNDAATGRGWKAAIKKQLGRELTGPLKGEAEELTREVLQLFHALLRELPVDCASVRQLVAARARAAVLSGRFAIRAAELGYDTPAGMAALDMATKLDARAERLAVTSLDLATKLAGKVGKRKVIDLGTVLANAAKPRGTP